MGEITERKYTKTCKFCGKTRTIIEKTDDMTDMDGRNYAEPRVWNDDKGCDCEFGKLAYKKYNLQEMCLNCKSYKNSCCTNAKELAEVSAMFDCGDKLTVKTPTKKCKYHELNANIFIDLVKKS